MVCNELIDRKQVTANMKKEKARYYNVQLRVSKNQLGSLIRCVENNTLRGIGNKHLHAIGMKLSNKMNEIRTKENKKGCNNE